MVRLPASAMLWVSAKIPNSPDMSIFPASPALLVSTLSKLLLLMATLSWASIKILPALPSPSVAADISELLLRVSKGVLMVMPSELPVAPIFTSEVI